MDMLLPFIGDKAIFSIIIMLITMITLHIINLKKDLKVINKAIKLTGIMLLFFGTLFTIYLFMYVFINIFILTYLFFKYSCDFFVGEEIGIYLSFLITLLIYGYFPEKIGFFVFRLCEKLERSNRNGFSQGYKSVIRFLRPKLWLYFLAFVLTILASIENITEKNLINYDFWINIKPYIFEAVITFVAFDSFITLLNDQSKEIHIQVSNIIKYIKDLLCSLKRDV